MAQDLLSEEWLNGKINQLTTAPGLVITSLCRINHNRFVRLYTFPGRRLDFPTF